MEPLSCNVQCAAGIDPSLVDLIGQIVTQKALDEHNLSVTPFDAARI